MTKADLMERAKQLKIDVTAKMTKDELIRVVSTAKNAKKKSDPTYWSGPVLAGDRLWTVNSRGEIWAIGAMDGIAKRFGVAGGPVTLAPVVANSTLYVINDDGQITAFR